MSTIILVLPELYEKYKQWVSKNPQKASDLETTIKWTSYFLAGRINNSHLFSELVYSMSNLLVLFNDRIIHNFQKTERVPSGERLKVWLTVLEYSEVFLELSAKQLWGITGKWFIIVAIQLLKCYCRLLLIYHHKENIIQHPPVPVLIRKDIPVNNDKGLVDLGQAQLDSVSFTLKRSGRVMRRVDASPAVFERDWKALECPQGNSEQVLDKNLAGIQLIAETIFIAKPIVHLGTMACFGSNRWKPWMISLAMDLFSLHLYKKSGANKEITLTQVQRLQISRRYVGLLLYLLRSPFYDVHSKKRIQMFLFGLSKKVPLAHMVCTPILKYLPFWQGNYFYMWST